MTDDHSAGRPSAAVVEIAHRIRLRFGFGGATFPGARELYEAAEKIENWAADAEKARNPGPFSRD